MWDGTGEELGNLKNELNDAIGYKGKDQLYFDRCIINGCKFYALKSDKFKWFDKSLNKETNEICRCKGYTQRDDDISSHLTFDQYRQKNNIKIEQRRDQFLCGMNGYSAEDNGYQIQIKEVKKRCPRKYNKGIVNKNGSITPLTIK